MEDVGRATKGHGVTVGRMYIVGQCSRLEEGGRVKRADEMRLGRRAIGHSKLASVVSHDEDGTIGDGETLHYSNAGVRYAQRIYFIYPAEDIHVKPLWPSCSACKRNHVTTSSILAIRVNFIC